MKKLIIAVTILFLIIVLSFVTEAQTRPKITFIELGSVSCIPCKKMQPVMKNIEKKFGEQIKVVFYDVMKQKEKIDEYKMKLMPTQVFLDENGKEIYRHEGFYPEKDIEKFLRSKGLK